MAQIYINNHAINGVTTFASAVTCIDEEGQVSTVQDNLDLLHDQIHELNDKFYKRSISLRTIGICMDGAVIVPYALPIEFRSMPRVELINAAIAGVSTETQTIVEVDETRTNTDEIVFKLTPTSGAEIVNGSCYFCMVYFTYE